MNAVEGWIYQSVKLVNCGFDVYLLYSFFELLFPVYEKRKKLKLIKAVCCVIAIFIVNSVGLASLNLIGVPLIFVLFIYSVFHIRLKLNVLYVVFYYVAFAVVEFSFQQIYQAMGIDIYSRDFKWIVRLVAEKIFTYMAIQILRRKKRYSPDEKSYPTLRRLFILPISSMILLNGFLVIDQYPSGYYLICLGGMLLVASNIVNFSMVDQLLTAEKAAKDNEMLALKTKMEHSHYQRMDEMNQEYALYVHEMHHIVQTIKQFAEQENAGKLKELSAEASTLLMKKKPFSQRLYLNDPIINTIFCERENGAKKAGVKFKIEVSPGVSLDFVSETDKIRIFGNLLDNALEAAKQCADGYVEANLYAGNESIVVFRIENNYVHQNKKRGKQFLSTKTDKKRHGFGLQQVEELAHRYQGILNVEEEDGRFIATLILSSVQKTEK